MAIIDKKDAEKYSKIFGEGSPSLTELIKYCILNDIKTIYSCKGHPDKLSLIDRINETGYITFVFDEPTKLAKYLFSLPLKIKGIHSIVDYGQSNLKTISLYVPANKEGLSDLYFKYILDSIKEYKQNNNYVSEPNISKLVDYIFSAPSDICVSLKNNSFQKHQWINGIMMKQIAKCPVNKKRSILFDIFNIKENSFDNLLNNTNKKR